MVGYAATATIRANTPPPAGESPRKHVYDYYESVLGQPEPRIAVVQNLDEPPAAGSFWGEVNANIFRALGCI